MAFKYTVRWSTALGDSVIIDDPVTALTAQDNVKGGAAIVYSVVIDCTNNTTSGVYLKMKDIAAIGTISTCQPDTQWYCPAGKVMQYTFPDGMAYAVGLSYYVSTDPGVGGAVAHDGTVKIRILSN